MQTRQQRVESAEVVWAERPGPVMLDLSDDLASDGLRRGTPLGYTNKLRAAIRRIRDTLDIAEAFVWGV